jgi:hypothetical protein
MRTLSRAASLLLLGVLLTAFAAPAFAQQSLSLSVTPPLIQLSSGTGDTWKGSLKIINSNSYDLTVYASAVDFAAEGDSGQGRFLPLDEAALSRGERNTLASWVEIPGGPITILREQSADIPLTVRIPEGASPGGHYAAVLVGTSPGIIGSRGKSDGSNETKVSSFVTTLLFLRIGGDVTEEAAIRDFSPGKTFYQKPEASFTLRFENKGNVHVLPQGSIVITNMWGKVRGDIPVNQKTDFGSVLPGQIRKYEFDWKGEGSPFEIGRYKAEVTIAYGSSGRKMVSSVTYFWVVPLVPVASTLTGLVLFIGFFVFSVRRYVRRAISLERSYLGISEENTVRPRTDGPAAPEIRPLSVRTLTRPLSQGVMDLRTVRSGKAAPAASLFTKYRLFIIFIIVVASAGLAGAAYFSSVLEKEKPFEASMRQGDGALLSPQ